MHKWVTKPLGAPRPDGLRLGACRQLAGSENEGNMSRSCRPRACWVKQTRCALLEREQGGHEQELLCEAGQVRGAPVPAVEGSMSAPSSPELERCSSCAASSSSMMLPFSPSLPAPFLPCTPDRKAQQQLWCSWTVSSSMVLPLCPLLPGLTLRRLESHRI